MRNDEQQRIFTKNLNRYIELSQKTQREIADAIGVSPQTFNTWCQGIAIPRMGKIQALADYFNINKSNLIEEHSVNIDKSEVADHRPNRIMVYGSVPAGIPIEAVEDIVDWEDIPMEWLNGGQKYIGLRVKGDSMYPKYIEGDTIIVRLQSDCESGQDAVVYVNGYDATLKKVVKNDDGIMLQPLNPEYVPKQYDYNDERYPISILGVVVEIRRKV